MLAGSKLTRFVFVYLQTAEIQNLKTRKIILFQDFKSCFWIYNLGSIGRKLSRQDCDNLEDKI